MKPSILFFAFLAIPCVIHGQESTQVLLNDSSAISIKQIDVRPLSPDFLILSLLPSKSNPELSPRFLYLSLSLTSTQNSSGVKRDLGIWSTWQSELLKQEKYKTLRTILGSIEAGGVAYLAYLHVKKYGFK